MSEFFDDYKYKNVSKRVGIKFRQKTCKILSPWQISSFINNFNTYYYKSEVMNTIGIALKQGVEPKNIIIFDQSFNFYQQYRNLKNIQCNTPELQYLYTLGKPVSIFPNKTIIFLFDLFTNFRRINEFLYQVNKKYLPINTINKYFNAFPTLGKQGVIELLRADASILIEKVKDKEVKERFQKIFEEMLKVAEKLDDDWASINDIEGLVKSENYREVKTKDRLYQKYFRRFYTLLTNVPRPVIGVYNEKNKSISILCRAHFNIKERNATTLDLKSISHNSPIEGLLVGGAAIYSTIKEEGRKDELHQIERFKRKLEVELEKEKIREQKAKTDSAELDNMIKRIEMLKQLSALEQSDEINAVKTIANPYIKQQISLEYDKLHSKSVQLMRKNNFEADPKDIVIFDVTV